MDKKKKDAFFEFVNKSIKRGGVKRATAKRALDILGLKKEYINWYCAKNSYWLFEED